MICAQGIEDRTERDFLLKILLTHNACAAESGAKLLEGTMRSERAADQSQRIGGLVVRTFVSLHPSGATVGGHASGPPVFRDGRAASFGSGVGGPGSLAGQPFPPSPSTYLLTSNVGSGRSSRSVLSVVRH